MPLKTRAGHAEAPIEPGARTLCEPCDFGPLAKFVLWYHDWLASGTHAPSEAKR